jgi:hypothetical protein
VAFGGSIAGDQLSIAGLAQAAHVEALPACPGLDVTAAPTTLALGVERARSPLGTKVDARVERVDRWSDVVARRELRQRCEGAGDDKQDSAKHMTR